MESTRNYSRIESSTPCVLLQVGDFFELMLVNDAGSYTTNFSCEVSRLDSSELGAIFYKLF